MSPFYAGWIGLQYLRGDMNKLDVNPTALKLAPASFLDPGPARRLIVLVPESEVDTASVTRRIWELANALESRVLFLGLSKDAAHEPSLRRQLVALSAIAEDGLVFVESKIKIGNDWSNAVLSEWHKGDVVVCFAGQRSGITRRPLSQILEADLGATVYVLAGVEVKEPLRSDAMAWIGSIGIIFLFLWLQFKIVQFPQDWAHTALLYVSLFAEVGLIWIWNNLFG